MVVSLRQRDTSLHYQGRAFATEEPLAVYNSHDPLNLSHHPPRLMDGCRVASMRDMDALHQLVLTTSVQPTCYLTRSEMLISQGHLEQWTGIARRGANVARP